MKEDQQKKPGSLDADDAQNEAKQKDQPKVTQSAFSTKRSLSVRVTDAIKNVNIYLLIFIFIVVIGIMITFFVYNLGTDTHTPPIETPQLPQEAVN